MGKIMLASVKPSNVSNSIVTKWYRKDILSMLDEMSKDGLSKMKSIDEEKRKICKLTWNQNSTLNKKTDLSTKPKYEFNPKSRTKVIEVKQKSDGWFLLVPIFYDGYTKQTEMFDDYYHGSY